jgi:hypothetical protein
LEKEAKKPRIKEEVTQMVKSEKQHNEKNGIKQGENGHGRKTRKIRASTRHGYTNEYLSPYGGLLPLVKLWDGLKFESLFSKLYCEPSRETQYGSLFFIKGLLLLLFIGFCRLHHFVYVSEDPMLLGILGMEQLPAVSTFWRYLQSIGHNQSLSLLRLMGVLRERAWKSLGTDHERIHIDVDTTVETVYGFIQGAKRGHNPGHRGKKGLRPVLAFISETREYLVGKLRRGETISGREVARFILSFAKLIPSCVKQVIVRMDAEMYSWVAVKACLRRGYDYIISVKRTRPPFDSERWYSVGRDKEIQYNHCFFQPTGWGKVCRFVAQRIPKERDNDPSGSVQFELFEDDRYKYRIFVTSLSSKPHRVIEEYDGRAGAENLIGEAKREGLAAIPSKKFQSNYAYFQIVMLSYNLWRYMVGFANLNDQKQKTKEDRKETIQNTIHISRLKLLFIAAKIIGGKNRVQINYSSHLSGKERLDRLIHNLDMLRKHPEILNSPIYWHKQCQFPMQKIFCTKTVA